MTLSANIAAAATGIVLVYYQASQLIDVSTVAINFNYPYFAISLSLNVLLTLMIVIRLVSRGRHIQNGTVALTITTRLCKAIVTMLIESFALYAINFLLFIALWATGSSVAYIFLPILANVQVCVFLFPVHYNLVTLLLNWSRQSCCLSQ